MPLNEPVPEPVPPKPRLESRVLISAASSCTLPSQCTTPEPVEDKTSGGYEDILDVLERLEDELDGKDKSGEDVRAQSSSTTMSRSTRSSSSSSALSSSRSSNKSGNGNLSKIK